MVKTNRLRILAAAAALAAVLLTAAGPAQGAIGGSNGNIVFGGNGDVWLTNSPGAPFLRTILTPDTPASENADPSISPDGRKVAFTSDRDEDGDFEIYTLDIYTGDLTKVTNNTVRDAQPAWSPDGRQIAYEEPGIGSTETEIKIRSADGTGIPTQVTSLVSGDAFAPSWRPAGGDEIAFHNNGDIKVRDLSVGDADPGAVRSITTDGPGIQDLLPNWSPDGSTLVFQSNRRAPDSTTDFELYTARSSDGGGVRQITNNTSPDGDAAYAPDGNTIVHSNFAAGNGDIVTADPGGSGFGETVVGDPIDDTAPDWGVVAPPAAPGCTISGTFANDTIYGDALDDTICSMNGDDEVLGSLGDDTIKGGAGRDTLYGNHGRDVLLGGGERDTLNSRDGVNRNDSLNGGPGRDRCVRDPREASVRSCP
jgi:tricorn protease-like protein